MQLTINSFRQLFPDKIFSLTIPCFTVKPWHFPDSCQIPDISRFSRQVVTLCYITASSRSAEIGCCCCVHFTSLSLCRSMLHSSRSCDSIVSDVIVFIIGQCLRLPFHFPRWALPRGTLFHLGNGTHHWHSNSSSVCSRRHFLRDCHHTHLSDSSLLFVRFEVSVYYYHYYLN